MPRRLRSVSDVLRAELAKAESVNAVAVAAGVPQPVLHRFLHRMHLEIEPQEEPQDADRPAGGRVKQKD